jgi:hypothetical protein
MARGNPKQSAQIKSVVPDAGSTSLPEKVAQFKPRTAGNDFDPDSKVMPSERLPKNSVGFSKFEDEIKGQTYESGGLFDSKGRMLVSKSQQSGNSVSWTVEDIIASQKEGIGKAILTHNHPGGGSFSEADFVALAQFKAGEERAISENFIYSMSAPPEFFKKYDYNMRNHRGNNMFPEKDAQKMERTTKELTKEIQKARNNRKIDRLYLIEYENFSLKNGRPMNNKEATEAYTHIMNVVVAEKLGLTYTRTPVTKK